MSARGRCKRKVKRITRESAEEALAERQASFPDQEWEIYTCRICGYFHVGTKETPARRLKRNLPWLRGIAERKRMKGYQWVAAPIRQVNVGLNAVMMVWMSQRIPGSPTDPTFRLLTRAAWIDAGYCIDAPETIPAGGCEFLAVDDDGSGLPVQLTITREEP